MSFKPTRQSQVNFSSGGGIPNFSGLRPTGVETAAKELRTLSGAYIKQAYDSAAKKSIQAAALAGIDVIDPNTGTIRQDMVSKGAEYWNSEAQQKYEATRDESIAARMNVKIEALGNRILATDKFGDDGTQEWKDANALVQNEISALRKQVEKYPVASANFDVSLEKMNSQVAATQLKNRFEKQQADEINDLYTTANSAVANIGSLATKLATVEGGREIIKAAVENFETVIADLSGHPGADTNTGGKTRALIAGFQYQLAEGVLKGILFNNFEEMRDKDSYDVDSINSEALVMATNLERNPALLAELVGTDSEIGIDLNLVDIDKLSQEVRRFGGELKEQANASKQVLIAENKASIDEWIVTNVNSVDDVKSLEGMTFEQMKSQAFRLDPNSLTQWSTLGTIMKAIDVRINSLKEDEIKSNKILDREVGDQFAARIAFVKNGSTTNEALNARGLKSVSQELANELDAHVAGTKTLPSNVLKDIRTALASNFNRDIDLDTLEITTFMGLIKSRPGSSESMNLIKEGNIALAKMEDKYPNANLKIKAKWLEFTGGLEQVQYLQAISTALEKYKQGKPIDDSESSLPLGSMENIVEINKRYNLGLGDDIERARKARANLDFQRDTQDQVTAFIAETPTGGIVTLSRTPTVVKEELQQLSEQLLEAAKTEDDKIRAKEQIAQMTDRAGKYEAKWNEAKVIDDKLGAYRDAWKSGIPVQGIADRAFIEKHAPPPSFDLSDSSTYPLTMQYVSDYGLLPSPMIETLKASLLQDEESFKATMSVFNSAVAQMVLATGQPKHIVQQKVLAQINGTDGTRNNDVRTNSMFQVALTGAFSFDEIKDMATKGTFASFNSLAKGDVFAAAGIDYKDIEDNNDALFQAVMKLTFDQDRSFGLEYWFGGNDSANEERFNQWLSSQKDANAAVTLATNAFSASPNLKYQILSLFRHEVVTAASSGMFDANALNGAVQRTWNRLSDSVSIEFEKVGTALLAPQITNQSLTGAALDVAAIIPKALNMMDDAVYAPRIVVNPAENQLVGTGLPTDLHPDRREILNNMVLRGLAEVPDSYLNNLGLRRTNVEEAIQNGYVYFRRTSPLGNPNGLDSYEVVVKTGIGDGLFDFVDSSFTTTLFSDFVPNYRADTVLNEAYNKALANGVDVKFLGQVDSYSKIFGSYAVREAVKNEINKPSLTGGATAPSAITIAALNTLADLRGLPRIENITSEQADAAANYFNLFTVAQ